MLRERVAEKVAEGYFPMVGSLVDRAAAPSDKARFTQMLLCFSELHSNEELFQQLRLWRRDQAVKESKSAFILATNSVLRMISAFVPHSTDELMQIPGFGPLKTKLYGDELIRITSAYPQAGPFPLDWVAKQVEPSQLENWFKTQQQLKYKQEYDKKTTKRTILEGLSQGKSIDGLLELVSVTRRELLQLVEELDKEGYDLSSLVEVELQSVPDDEQLRAWNAFAEQGDRYLKPVLACVYSEEQLANQSTEKMYEWLRLLRIKFRKSNGAAAVQAG